MGKPSRIKKGSAVATESAIKKSPIPDGTLKFSFKLFDPSDGEVCPAKFNDGYTQALMQRLQNLSSWLISEFTGPCHHSIRNHRISWEKTKRPDGFTHLNEQFESYEPWQFSVSVNAHGRVHGVIIDDCFYIVWLDCNHIVYS